MKTALDIKRAVLSLIERIKVLEEKVEALTRQQEEPHVKRKYVRRRDTVAD